MNVTRRALSRTIWCFAAATATSVAFVAATPCFAARGGVAARGDNCTNWPGHGIGFPMAGAPETSTDRRPLTPYNNSATIVDQATVETTAAGRIAVVAYLVRSKADGYFWTPASFGGLIVSARGLDGRKPLERLSPTEIRRSYDDVRTRMDTAGYERGAFPPVPGAFVVTDCFGSALPMGA